MYVPPLREVLEDAEHAKGRPLTQREVESMAVNASVMTVSLEAAIQTTERRGFRDIDPKASWVDWVTYRIVELGKTDQQVREWHRSDSTAIFIPALRDVLEEAEARKVEPLTEGEMESIADDAVVMTVGHDIAIRVAERRGFRDIDPVHCWSGWVDYKRGFGETNELPVARTVAMENLPGYKQTIADAQATLGYFRARLSADG